MAFKQVKVFAAAAALTIEAQQSVSKDAYTVNIEAARKIPDTDHYDWANKLTIQLTRRELPECLSVLAGYRQSCEFGFHGIGRNKRYSLEAQTDGILYKAQSPEHGQFAVPITLSDRFEVSALMMSQLQRNFGGLSSDILLELLKSTFRANGRT